MERSLTRDVSTFGPAAMRLGRTAYDACWALQRSMAEQRARGEIPDTLLLTEHDHVYTMGTGSDENHLLAGAEELRERGIAVVRNDRGGDITYHGPGQLVGYPIIDLHDHYLDLHRYLRELEDLVILALAGYGLRGERVEGYTGVWVGGEKICAIGIKSSRWITTHGFALNVNTDLSFFDRIIPCGIFEKGVTSMAARLGGEIPMTGVEDAVIASFLSVFGPVHQSL
jgi:lipoyl(octanoyl) transferase